MWGGTVNWMDFTSEIRLQKLEVKIKHIQATKSFFFSEKKMRRGIILVGLTQSG